MMTLRLHTFYGHKSLQRRGAESYVVTKRGYEAWLQPTVVDNKNVTGKLSSFFHRPGGRNLD